MYCSGFGFGRYVYSLYWSTVTVPTVGYGDILPVSINEKIVTIFLILIGEQLHQRFPEALESIDPAANVSESCQWQPSLSVFALVSESVDVTPQTYVQV